MKNRDHHISPHKTNTLSNPYNDNTTKLQNRDTAINKAKAISLYSRNPERSLNTNLRFGNGSSNNNRPVNLKEFEYSFGNAIDF